MTAAAARGDRRLIVAALSGAAVAVTLGVYGHVHDPSQKLIFTLFFSETISMKVWFATVALGFAIVQLGSALWLFGKIGPQPAPEWLGSAHRISGRLASSRCRSSTTACGRLGFRTRRRACCCIRSSGAWSMARS